MLHWSDIPLSQPAPDTAAVPLDIAGLDPALPPTLSAVSMGNPHAVFFVADIEAHDLSTIGPVLEHHPLFPERANISLGDGALALTSEAARLGTGCGADAGLRHRRLRRDDRRHPGRVLRSPGDGQPPRRRSCNRLAGRRACDHDGGGLAGFHRRAAAVRLDGSRLMAEEQKAGMFSRLFGSTQGEPAPNPELSDKPEGGAAKPESWFGRLKQGPFPHLRFAPERHRRHFHQTQARRRHDRGIWNRS